MRVFILEDDPEISSLERLVLSGAGYQVTLVDCSRALDPLAWSRAGVAVVDLSLPGVSGVDVLHMLRRELPQVWRVVASAVEWKLRPEDHEADVILAKPFLIDELLAAVGGG